MTVTPAILSDALLMLVIMNPFAQMLYLSDLMNRTSTREFGLILTQGVLMTFAICLTCAFLGQLILFRIFQISLPELRVFGGLVNLHLTYSYVMRGPEGIKLFSGSITEVAQQIAMPIMVGAGVVWICMRIGERHHPVVTVAVIGTIVTTNGLLIFGYQQLFRKVTGRLEQLLIKYFGIAMRFTALLVGALSIQMILSGIAEFLIENRFIEPHG